MEYKDRWLKICGISFIVFSTVHMGREGAFIELLQNRDNYYFDLLFSLTVTWSVWQVTRYIIKKLDVKIPWKTRLYKRLLVQLPVTLTASALLLTSITLVYTSIMGIGFYQVMAPDAELLMGLIFTLIINLLYLILYLLQRGNDNEGKTDRIKLVGMTGNRKSHINLDNVAYFYSRNKIVFAVQGMRNNSERIIPWIPWRVNCPETSSA
ncbi:hypothetical protein FNH22_08055 [Fulvivirga sp. M361]|uniref:hypothetical protein n=1 Tax=Fulvivirga sp. M361 TaxID=2594266 RepID=UPI00117B10E3|nr:hypothetical protein [Fulvivirga sp. M361]TRX59997.1 hypothetical protein FNH22_08055 [Fulvivirga sp. M361]